MSEPVIINDVGPRDGLQNQPTILSPAQRLQLIQALVDAGVTHIECGAFVSPKAVPAMAGTEDIAAQLPEIAQGRSDLAFTALIPNAKGYERARDAGLRSVGLVVAASNTMNEKNIRMRTDAALDVCTDVIAQARADGVEAQVYLATAWRCPFEGDIAPQQVIHLAEQLQNRGADLVVISDTIGAAHPGQVRSLMSALQSALPADRLSCHFHDTRALAIANVYAALEAGIRRFDASIGGLGGCPFAPGATGNVATEDLAMLLGLMGFETGIDLDKLLAAGQLAGELTGQPTGGRAYPWLSRNSALVRS